MGLYPYLDYKFIRVIELINRFKCKAEFYTKEEYYYTDIPDDYYLNLEFKHKCELYNLPYHGFEDNMALFNKPVLNSKLYYGSHAVELDDITLSLMKKVYKLLLKNNKNMLK